MTKFAKYINRVSVQLLPKTWTWSDGSTTSGFDTVSEETKRRAGFVPLLEVEKPPRTETEDFTAVYTNGDPITMAWVAEAIPQPDPLPQIYSKLKIIEQLQACEVVHDGVNALTMFKQILAQSNLTEIWDTMIFLAGDDARVQTIISSVEVQTIMSNYSLDIASVLVNAEDESLRVLWRPTPIQPMNESEVQHDSN